MSNSNSNYPQGAATKALNGTEFTQVTTTCLLDLQAQGKPQTLEELKERTKKYFEFCANSRLRPCVETLAVALGVSRQTLWEWSDTEHCNKSAEWCDTVAGAKQLISAFTSQAALSGHLSPPIAIFLLKNIAGYRDQVSFEELTPKDKSSVPLVEFPTLGNFKPQELPNAEG